MRIAVVILVLGLAACGKKKAPQAPAPDNESSEMKQDADEKDVNAPAQGEDPTETRTSDPQEGGE
jgi:hypothetical protein